MGHTDEPASTGARLASVIKLDGLATGHSEGSDEPRRRGPGSLATAGGAHGPHGDLQLDGP